MSDGPEKTNTLKSMSNNIRVIRLVVGQLSANCYIVGSGHSGEGFVLDPGGSTSSIIKAIAESGFSVSSIILTHGHSDHIAALHDIQKYTGAHVMVHRADEDFFVGYGPVSSQFGISYPTPAPPDRLLDDGDIIDISDLSLSVIHTPGHTPGSICLLCENLLFSGDTLLRRSIGTTLMPGSSRRQLIGSIRTRLLTLPDDTIVRPGHGKETTIGDEKSHNRYLT